MRILTVQLNNWDTTVDSTTSQMGYECRQYNHPTGMRILTVQLLHWDINVDSPTTQVGYESRQFNCMGIIRMSTVQLHHCDINLQYNYRTNLDSWVQILTICLLQ